MKIVHNLFRKNSIFRRVKPQKNDIVVNVLFQKINSITTAAGIISGFQLVNIEFVTVHLFQNIPELLLWQQQTHTSMKLKDRGQRNLIVQELLQSLCLLHAPRLGYSFLLPFAVFLPVLLIWVTICSVVKRICSQNVHHHVKSIKFNPAKM